MDGQVQGRVIKTGLGYLVTINIPPYIVERRARCMGFVKVGFGWWGGGGLAWDWVFGWIGWGWAAGWDGALGGLASGFWLLASLPLDYYCYEVLPTTTYRVHRRRLAA